MQQPGGQDVSFLSFETAKRADAHRELRALRPVEREGAARLPAHRGQHGEAPAPRAPLYSAGARPVANYGHGPIRDGLGPIHPIFSHCGRIAIDVTACRAMLPDPRFYEECLEASFQELRAATVGA